MLKYRYLYNIRTGTMLTYQPPFPRDPATHNDVDCCRATEAEGSALPCNGVVAEELLLQALGWESVGIASATSRSPSLSLPVPKSGPEEAGGGPKADADTGYFYNMYTGETVRGLGNVVHTRLTGNDPPAHRPTTPIGATTRAA